jgi:DNA-binding PucR family transcriptional regulator
LALERGEGGPARTGLATQFEREIAGFASGELPRGEFELVAVGPERHPAALPVSFRAAGRVLGAAERFGLAGVHDLASAGLHAAVIESPELGSALCERLVAPVMALPGGGEIVASVRAWLACGMRTDPAAERLFVHPNTVRYRLRRYEELTGVDLRETEDAFRVWWALHREELVAPDGGADGMPAQPVDGSPPAAEAPPAPA